MAQWFNALYPSRDISSALYIYKLEISISCELVC